MKHLIILCLALFSSIYISAQGICDSNIVIYPMPSSFCQGANDQYVQVSHYGGVFNGPGMNNTTSPILKFENIPVGFHTVSYTVTGPGGCTQTVSRSFEVKDAEEASIIPSGTIDCNTPGSTVLLEAFASNNPYFNTSWTGPQGANLVANGWNATTNMAGRYRFKAQPFNQGACPAYAYQDVAFSNAPPSLAIENCTNCDENNGNPPLRLKLNPVPPNWQASIKTPNGVVSITQDGNCNVINYGASGLWTAEIKNAQNGCKVTTSAVMHVGSLPNVSSGSNLGVFCGFVGHFIAAMWPQTPPPGVDFFWTTPDGSVVPASNGSTCPAPIPGLYILHARNTFFGCEKRDTSVATLAPTPVSSSIQVICAGESYGGHNQTGTYVDTIALPNGCPKIQKLKLIVLAPLADSYDVSADNGTSNGSIEYTVTQGWPPYVYDWSNGENSPSITNLSAGTYTVSVTDANNCIHIREIEVPAGKPVGPLRFRDLQPFSQARLFPNPSIAGQTDFTLELVADQPSEAELMLTDILGRNVFAKPVQIVTGKNVFNITEPLLPGVYTLLLKSNLGMKEVSKLVVAEE